jgi:hypothetical protein
MKKILYIVPHLSTGGLPQYTLKMIKEFMKDYDVYCLEYSNHTGGVYVVQRNQVVDLLKDKFFTLDDDKTKIIDIIKNGNFDVLHFQEVPDHFIDTNILYEIYSENRNYNIVVTTHGSATDPSKIIFGADKYILVSEWSKDRFTEVFDESICDIWEYPIEKIEYDKDAAKNELGFDTEYKHVLNVGLFTPGKNQKELIELSKEFVNEKVKFHFVGNQAINFKHYWEPIMKEFPNNCIWHGERNDVDKFYKAADAFYFSSNLELNPLVVKEALSYGLPTFIKKLPTYKNSYDNLVEYITSSEIVNANKLRNVLYSSRNNDEIVLIVSHPNNEYRINLLKECVGNISRDTILSTNFPIDQNIQNNFDFVLYSRNNPVLFKDDYNKYDVAYYHWWIDENNNRHEKLFEYEHGYAAYTLIQNGLRYAKSIGKTKIHVINYDYLIQDELLKHHYELLNDYDLVLYKHDNTNYGDISYSSGIMSGDIDTLLNFFNKYNTISEYYLDRENGRFGVLEVKLHQYYSKTTFKIHVDNYENIPSDNKLDREGTGEFSVKL